MTLLLPWFPIILGVGVGGRLLGRTRGYALGVLCALFWVLLSQSALGVQLWLSPWGVTAVIFGAAAIIAMGGWSGESSRPDLEPPDESSAGVEVVGGVHGAEQALSGVADVMQQFDDWLERHARDVNPWPKFDEFLRGALYQCCRATHVRPYRLRVDARELEPLLEPDALEEPVRISARQGVIGHVVTTGRTFIEGDPIPDEPDSPAGTPLLERPLWCFAVSKGTARLGIVTVRRFEVDPREIRTQLKAVERMVNRFWCELDLACRWRSAAMDDAISGLYTREAFLLVADAALAQSYQHGEPSAVAVVALEGLREVDDGGQWETADDLIRSVSRVLRGKVREDDRLGRFDGSRFVVLLRRVDTELASLIIAQIVSRLTTLCEDKDRWGAAVRVRCGVVCSDRTQPSLRELLSAAITRCHHARQAGLQIISDREPAHRAEGAPA